MKTLRVAVAAVVLPLLGPAQQPTGPLNDQKIVDLVSMGVSEGELLRIIATAPVIDFDLRPVSTDALTKAGVSESVMKAMAGRETGGIAAGTPSSKSESAIVTPSSVRSTGSTATGQERFGNVEYLHATTNGKHRREDGLLAIDSSARRLTFESNQKDAIGIPGDQISRVAYERAAKPRYAAGLLIAWPLLFTKSKQHYLTVQYRENGQGDYAVFRLSKHNYREILAAIESATGQKVDRQEER